MDTESNSAGNLYARNPITGVSGPVCHHGWTQSDVIIPSKTYDFYYFLLIAVNISYLTQVEAAKSNNEFLKANCSILGPQVNYLLQVSLLHRFFIARLSTE